MAKRSSRKKSPAAEAPTPAAKPSEVRPAVTERKLKELIRSHRSAKNDISEISGALGSEIKNAVEKNYLHRTAFNIVAKADRMEPEKLADFLDCLSHYLDISGLNDRAAQVQKMQFGPGDADGGDEDDGNVRRFPQPEGVAAE